MDTKDMIIYLLVLAGIGIGIGFIMVASTNKKRRAKRNKETAARSARLNNIDIIATKDYNNLPNEYVALCVKTTGANAVTDDIVDVCALKVNDGKIKQQFSQLVQPRIAIPSTVLVELGVGIEAFKKKPPVENVIPEVVKFIGDLPIITYNEDVNINFLVANSVKELDNRCVDVLAFAKNTCQDLDRWRIRDIAKKFSIDVPSTHNALNDCKVICKCYEILKKRYETK